MLAATLSEAITEGAESHPGAAAGLGGVEEGHQFPDVAHQSPGGQVQAHGHGAAGPKAGGGGRGTGNNGPVAILEESRDAQGEVVGEDYLVDLDVDQDLAGHPVQLPDGLLDDLEVLGAALHDEGVVLLVGHDLDLSLHDLFRPRQGFGGAGLRNPGLRALGREKNLSSFRLPAP